MKKPYAVVFAGVPGSSKTIVAHYLSERFSLPIFSNDTLRYEVKEDMLINELILPEDLQARGINVPEALAEYERRLTNRRNEILLRKNPVVFDGSVDRRWAEMKKQLAEHGYGWYMINMELSRKFLEKLFSGTGRAGFIPQLDRYFAHHQQFLSVYSPDIHLQISDENFKDRLKDAAKGLAEFIDSIE